VYFDKCVGLILAILATVLVQYSITLLEQYHYPQVCSICSRDYLRTCVM